MASERQIAANRRNARRGRGPRTGHGKARSSRNALRHGLTARKHLLAGESWEHYQRLCEQICAALNPKGALEIELAQQIVSVLWRLRRIPAFEAALMARLLEEEARSARLYEDDDEAHSPDDEDDPQLALGTAIRDFLRHDYSDKLDRYQASLQRQFSALLKALHELQARRHEEEEGQNPRLAIAMSA